MVVQLTQLGINGAQLVFQASVLGHLNVLVSVEFLCDIVICLEESLLLLVIGVSELLRILLTIIYTEFTEKFRDIYHLYI